MKKLTTPELITQLIKDVELESPIDYSMTDLSAEDIRNMVSINVSQMINDLYQSLPDDKQREIVLLGILGRVITENMVLHSAIINN